MPRGMRELYERAPYVGAMLRIANQNSRRRLLSALLDRGFTDLNQALLSGLLYPLTQGGMRPIDMAENTNMTKQAMNYIVGQLEARGYIERQPEEVGDRRVVYLTRRGWQVFETIWRTQRQLEAEWAERVGKKRFDEFMKTLRQLSGVEEESIAKVMPRSRNRARKKSLALGRSPATKAK
jgi:DNA-binding MarR family transcriptional regulator